MKVFISKREEMSWRMLCLLSVWFPPVCPRDVLISCGCTFRFCLTILLFCDLVSFAASGCNKQVENFKKNVCTVNHQANVPYRTKPFYFASFMQPLEGTRRSQITWTKCWIRPWLGKEIRNHFLANCPKKQQMNGSAKVAHPPFVYVGCEVSDSLGRHLTRSTFWQSEESSSQFDLETKKGHHVC